MTDLHTALLVISIVWATGALSTLIIFWAFLLVAWIDGVGRPDLRTFLRVTLGCLLCWPWALVKLREDVL